MIAFLKQRRLQPIRAACLWPSVLATTANKRACQGPAVMLAMLAISLPEQHAHTSTGPATVATAAKVCNRACAAFVPGREKGVARHSKLACGVGHNSQLERATKLSGVGHSSQLDHARAGEIKSIP